MKAVVQEKFGPPKDVLSIKEIDRPSVGEDEVLVRVHAASIHIGDYYTIGGLPYVMRPMFASMRAKNRVPGTDIAGVVEEVGAGVSDLEPGDEVFGSHKGAFAEYAAFPAKALALKPTNLTFAESSAIGVSAFAALHALRDHGKVEPGQEVLITGASGGVGTFAVQIAKALGADVTGVCSTRNLEMVRSLGADKVIDYTVDDFTEGEQRYDLILDNVGNHSLSTTRKALKPTGTLLANGAPVGGWFGGLKNPIAASISSIFVRQQGRPFLSTPNPKDLNALKEFAEAEQIKAAIDKTYPLSETPTAVATVGEGHAQGKTVVTVE